MSSRFSSGAIDIISAPPSSARCITKTRILGALLGIFIISTVALAIVYGFEKASKTSTGTLSTTVTPSSRARRVQVDQNLCLTPYCIKAADYLIESIDETVEPCEDFFSFVCGTWVKNTRIPDDAGAQSTFINLRNQLDNNVVEILSSLPEKGIDEPKAVQNARAFYRSCINETSLESDSIDVIISLIDDELGGWPILQGPSWNDSTFDPLERMLNFRKYNRNLFFRIGTSTDEKNSTVYDIEVGQGDLGLGQKDYYGSETDITVAYRRFMKELATAFAKDPISIETDVNDMFELEKNISKHHWSSAEQRARANETVQTNFGDLQNKLNTSFDFVSYLQRAYFAANITLVKTDIVYVYELEFLRNVSALIRETSPRTLQNYMVWRFLMNRVADMPQTIRIFRDRFERIFRGTTAEQARTMYCANFVNDNMGFAVSKLYINRYFDASARNQSFEMINTIQDAFIDMLQKNTWMDTKSMNLAIEKAKAIDRKIGYPDYLGSDNNTKLEEDYAEYIFGSSHINNVIKLLQIIAKQNFQMLRKSVDRKAWSDMAPSIVNAFYDPSKNQITFPAGILQKPFFDKDAPKYLNYGGIGVVIGHEITHGFDDEGRQFDKDGNRIPWWTEETIQKFIERKTCIVNQYSNYTVAQVNMTANGFQTQGEDIADNGGLRESFFAYQKWSEKNPNIDKRLPGLQKYTPEQMFFINYAHVWCIKMTDNYAVNRIRNDVHSLGQFRAIGPTSNFDQFDRAFGCRPGQRNSRINKCIVW